MARDGRANKRWLRTYGDDLVERLDLNRALLKSKEDDIKELKREIEKDEAEYDALFNPGRAAARAAAVAGGGPASSSGTQLSLKKARLDLKRSIGTQTDD